MLLKLYAQLLPVMAFIPAGYFAARKWDIRPDTVSGPLIKILLPLVVFFNVLDVDAEKLYSLPLVTFILAAAMAPIATFVQKKLASDTDPLLLRSSFSFFNIAFFGIPTISALFGQEEVGALICIYLGSAFYGDTIGFYQVAKTKLPAKKALREVLSIPFIYVFIAAVICKTAGLETPEFLKPVLKVISFIVSALGMAVVGLQLDLSGFRLGYFLKITIFRAVAAGILMTILIFGASQVFDSLEKKDFIMLALVPLFPIAANVMVFASFLKTEEQQSSSLVFVSTLFSLVAVSLAVLFF